jgi:ribosome maturation factor RimP
MNETSAGTGDDRLIRESGIDARVANVIQPVLKALGMRLVRVRLSGKDGLTLQVMAEREDGTMTVEDCEEASRALSPALDVEDPIEKAYNLEVSSPGIDRPLVRKADFAAGKGHQVKIDTSITVGGRKRFRGKLAEVEADGIVIEEDKLGEGEEPTAAKVPFEAISDARLVLTDDLIRAALRQDKKARQELKKRRKGKSDEPPAEKEQAENEQAEDEQIDD